MFSLQGEVLLLEVLIELHVHMVLGRLECGPKKIQAAAKRNPELNIANKLSSMAGLV